MVSDVQISVSFIVMFLLFISECRQFFVLMIISIIVALMGVYIDSYFVLPLDVHYWIVLVFGMISIYGLSKSIHLARKAYRKGKLLMEEVY